MARTAAVWTLVGLVALDLSFVGFAAFGSARFERRVAAEARGLWLSNGSALEPRQWEPLPRPARRYLERAVGRRATGVRTVRLVHGGTFRPTLDGAWSPIKGVEYFTTDPPGFVWWGRLRVGPGLWVDARDRSEKGRGGMLIQAESLLTLGDRTGPELDQAALLRLLGEMVWFPTAFLDGRYVAWSASGDTSAIVRLRVEGHEASCILVFGDDGLPVRASGKRYRDLGSGRAELTPWSGEIGDYRSVEGLLVPYRVTANWDLPGRTTPYARFTVERLEYDRPLPF
jgi:hypothetical protein